MKSSAYYRSNMEPEETQTKTTTAPFVCDIIIPVYNALSQMARCVASVLKHSTLPHRILVINDASDDFTTITLRETAKKHDKIILLENETNQGFLHSANRGLNFGLEKIAQPNFKIVLNSDTVVTAGWLEAFQQCFDQDARIGLVTPVSNNAENLSLAIPEGFSLESLASLVNKEGQTHSYPDITTAIGFCLGIRTSVLKEVGDFDEIFAPGYAEDSDFHFRVLSRAYRSVLVPNCFIYHESHASFSDSKQRLVERNRPVFDDRWGNIYKNELAYHDTLDTVAQLKKRVTTAITQKKEKEHDVIFLLPTAKLCGGVIVVYEIINRLTQLGMDANAIILSDPESIEMSLLFSPYFRPPLQWKEDVPKGKIYVATHYETCLYAFAAHANHPSSKLVYLIQGYESWFPGASLEEVLGTYQAIPNRVVVSGWLRSMLARWNCDSIKISDGVDPLQFYPTDSHFHQPQGAAQKSYQKNSVQVKRPTLLTMLRNDPQGGWRIGFQIIQKIKKLHPELRVIAVGDLSIDERIQQFCDESYPHVNRRQIRSLYQEADVFLDCSMVQGFGLMGLEAMSSGVATVLSKSGGVLEYADQGNALLCPIGEPEAMIKAIGKLLGDKILLEKLREAGRNTAERLNWDSQAKQYFNYFQKIMKQGAELSSENFLAMVKYQFLSFLTSFTIQESLNRGQEELSDGLSDPQPLAASELLVEKKQFQVLEHLQSTHEGNALLRLYEDARALVAEAHTPEGGGVSNVGRSVGNTLLKKIATYLPDDL